MMHNTHTVGQLWLLSVAGFRANDIFVPVCGKQQQIMTCT